MAQHEEPMDIDSSVCDFDNKENAFQHINVLPRTPCTEKGYEELDVSELNMKLRYSTTPTLLPMSKSYIANCLDNRTFDSSNNIVDNGSLTRSMNSAVPKNDSVVRQQMCLPLQSIPAEQGHIDTNRNTLRPLDTTVTLHNEVIAVSTPNDTDENLSLPSSSSSVVHTPEVTTSNKGELKGDVSPIMRGLKSVINMFRPSQSPISPVEDETVSVKPEVLSPPIVLSPECAAEKPQAVASTPLSSQKSKDGLTKRISPNRDSLVFSDDLEKELQWKDETTIIFGKERIPIHKLLFQNGKLFEAKATKDTKTVDENLDNTVEYMDISYNDSINKTLEFQSQNLPDTKSDAVANESDGEFVDCESSFTKSENQGDLSELNDVSLDENGSIRGAKLTDIKETLDATITIVESDNLSIASTETVKNSTIDKEVDNVKESEGASTQKIKNMETCVHPTMCSLPVDIDFKQAVPVVASNVSVILDQNDTFNIEVTTIKEDIDSNAQIDSNTDSNFAIFTNRNENMLNVLGIGSLSQIPLISDPRVLLFNISSENIPNTESVSHANAVNEEKTVNVSFDCTPADIPLPDDDEVEKVSSDDKINNMIEVTKLLTQDERNHFVENKLSTSTESVSRFEGEETLHAVRTHCDKPVGDILDIVQVSNEVTNVIETAITTVEQIIKGTGNQDTEPSNINDGIKTAHKCSDLNETNIILDAIENVANEIASIPQRQNTPNFCSSSVDIVGDVDIVEELQKTIERLEGEGKSSTTLDKTIVETSSVAVNESENTNNEIKEKSKQNEDNFSVLPDILASGDFKLANSVESDTTFTINQNSSSEFCVTTEVRIDNIVTEEQKPFGDKMKIGDDMIHENFKTDTFVKSTMSNIHLENKETITQNVAISDGLVEDDGMKRNDHVEVDTVKGNNVTANGETITPTDETTDMSKQTPVPGVNVLSSLTTTASITILSAEKTENVSNSEELSSDHCVQETLQIYQNNNEEPVPDNKFAHFGTAEFKADNNDAMDEEIVTSANNSPFVSVSATFEEILEKKPEEHFENVIPVEINEEIRKSSSSPKIVSKGYNFNFDDIEDPFATKANIRMSPPLDVTTNQSFDETNDTDISKKQSIKKDFNREKRKSQPFRKKPSTTNNKINATFSRSPKDTTEKSIAKSKPLSNKMNAKEIKSATEPTIDSMEIDRTLSESQNTPGELIDLSVNNKGSVSVQNAEDIVSIDVNLSGEISNAEKYFVIDKHVENKVQIEYETFANSATSVIEIIKNASSSEHSAYYSAGTSSNEGLESKSSYNIPEINDTNFNPFTSKSEVKQSPSPSLDTSFVTKKSPDFSLEITKDNYIDGSTKKSQWDKENDLSNSINNITSSSKNTDKVNTEDEDTIEGPFLEAEDLIDDNKASESEAEILINNKNIIDISSGDHDMLQFSDFPTTDEGVADAGELFIDAEAFEFLLNQNQSNAVADNGKESLFLKFDPLFAKRISSDGVITALKNVQKRQSTPQKVPTRSDATFIAKSPAPEPSSLNVTNELDDHDITEDSTDELNITIAKPMMVVNPAVNPIATPRTKFATPVASNRRSLTFTSPAIAVIDRLLSLSANDSAIAHETTIAEVSRDQNEADHALTQLRELLADKEINVYTLRSEAKELKDRLSNMESQVKSLEIISGERLKKINELTEKLNEKTKHNKSMAKVVEEYERTIASLIAEKEQDKKRHADERIQLIRERDEQVAHLASMEVSFSDLHSKYEKSKQIILSLKTNEEVYKKSIKDFEDNLSKMQNNYELLKQHATSKLNHANEELQKINRAHEAEVLKMNAMIKRKELHITSLEETVSQKTKANEELTAICDELINKVSSR